jgi:hypothetical protein
VLSFYVFKSPRWHFGYHGRQGEDFGCCSHTLTVLAVDDRHVAFCEYNGSVARIICVAVATLANEKLLERASDNDLLLCRKPTSNKMRYRQWFDRCIISKMILKSGSNWLFPVVFSVEITLFWSHSGNGFEFSHRLTGFLNYALFCLSFCLRLNLKPVNYFTTKRSSMAKRESGSVRPDTCSLWVRSPS